MDCHIFLSKTKTSLLQIEAELERHSHIVLVQNSLLKPFAFTHCPFIGNYVSDTKQNINVSIMIVRPLLDLFFSLSPTPKTFIVLKRTQLCGAVLNGKTTSFDEDIFQVSNVSDCIAFNYDKSSNLIFLVIDEL